MIVHVKQNFPDITAKGDLRMEDTSLEVVELLHMPCCPCITTISII